MEFTLFDAMEAVDEYLEELMTEGENGKSKAARKAKLKRTKAFQKERTKVNKEKKAEAVKQALLTKKNDSQPLLTDKKNAAKDLIPNSKANQIKHMLATVAKEEKEKASGTGLATTKGGLEKSDLNKVLDRKGTGANVAGAVAGAAGAVGMHKVAKIKEKALHELEASLDREMTKSEPDDAVVSELKKNIREVKAAKTASRIGSVLFGAVGAYNTAQGIAKNLPVKESVDELRLQVFEAAEAGLIDEDEKVTMLEYLNLENYE